MTHARLLALALLALPVAPVSTALTGTGLAAPASTLSGPWKGKLDGFYELDAKFTVQGNSVTGVLRFGRIDFPFQGTWDAAKNLVTFKYTAAKEVHTVKATLKGSTLTGFNISPKGMQTAVSLTRVMTAGANAGAYVMTGTVRDEKGSPIAGALVFADHTAYHNMNAVGKTDAQGRYRIPLAHQPGTWNAGAYLRREAGGQPFEVRLSPDDDTPFDGSKGAVRNFTYKASTGATGKVHTYVAHSAVEVDYETLEFTFSPDGPNAAGSTAPLTRKFVMGSGVPNIPLGRYRVSATHMLNGVKQQLLLGSRQQKNGATSVLAEFTDDSHYGQTLELFLKNP